MSRIDAALLEPSNLAGMVAYQPGTIVSRTLVGGRAGTVTLFAFDAGQALSEHTAPFDALVQILEGKARITLAGEPHALSAGDVLLMPAGRPHAVDAVDACKFLLTMLRDS